jgi:hypothetical protein
MSNLDTYWPEILDVVRQKVAQQTFNTWFLPLHPENTEVDSIHGSAEESPGNGSNGSLKVACPNHFFMDWFSEHHLTALNEDTGWDADALAGMPCYRAITDDEVRVSLAYDKDAGVLYVIAFGPGEMQGAMDAPVLPAPAPVPAPARPPAP